MNFKNLFSLFFGAFIFLSVSAADKLAVVEPIGKGGVKATEIEALWGILETSVQSDEYKLITRSALKQMMTEIGLTTSSDLVNLNSSQKAKLGQLDTVKYILITEVAKFGTRYNCTMRILDSSTGEIDQARTANLRFKDMDELADKIEATVQHLLSDNKKSNSTAILYPIITAPRAPAYLPDNFNAYLEQALLRKGVSLQHLQTVDKILKANNLGKLYELEPKMYVKVGKLLEVRTLILTHITNFEIVGKKNNIEESGARGIRWIGKIEGFIKVISTRNGRTIATIPFDESVRLRSLDRNMTRDWTPNDYGKYLIKLVIPKSIVPELIKVPALMGK